MTCLRRKIWVLLTFFIAEAIVVEFFFFKSIFSVSWSEERFSGGHRYSRVSSVVVIDSVRFLERGETQW